MQQIVENQVRANIEFLAYVHRRQSSDIELFDRALNEGSIQILTEAKFDEDEIASNIENTRRQISDVVKLLPDSELKNKLTELGKEIPQGAEISGAMLDGDKEAMKDLSKRVMKSTEVAGKWAATIVTAFARVGKQFERFEGNLDESERELTLDQLGTKVKNDPDVWKGKFITGKQLFNGLAKAFVVPDWYYTAEMAGLKRADVAKGWLEKVKSVFEKWSEVDPDARFFRDTVKNMKFGEFMTASKEMAKIESKMKSGADDAPEASAELAAAADGQAPIEDAGDQPGTTTSDEDANLDSGVVAAADAAADDVADAMGKMPVPKKKLTALLKRPEFANITGKGDKATVARRKLRLAINKIAKKTVFEEGLLTGARRSKATSTDDDEAFNRWKELAGIKS